MRRGRRRGNGRGRREKIGRGREGEYREREKIG